MRNRLAHPGLFENEILGSNGDALILFLGLTMLADREGRFKWRPRIIEAHIFPLRTVNIEALLKFLTDNKLIGRYEVEGLVCGHVRNFAKYQRPHRNEAKSDLPAPPSDIYGSPLVDQRNAKGYQQRSSKKIEIETEIGIQEEGSGEKPKRKRRAFALDLITYPPSLNTPLGHKTLTKWLDYKRARGEAYKTVEGVEALLNLFANQTDAGFARAVEASMASNYAGLFTRNAAAESEPGMSRSERNLRELIADANRQQTEANMNFLDSLQAKETLNGPQRNTRAVGFLQTDLAVVRDRKRDDKR